MNIKMSLFVIVACSLAVISTAAPGLPLALSAPIAAPAAVAAVPAPVVTAYSSQYVSRNYNGIAVAPAAVVPGAAYYGYPQVYAPTVSYSAGLPLVEDYLFK